MIWSCVLIVHTDDVQAKLMKLMYSMNSSNEISSFRGNMFQIIHIIPPFISLLESLDIHTETKWLMLITDR